MGQKTDNLATLPTAVEQTPNSDQMTKQQEFLYEHNHCYLCGHELTFSQKTSFSDLIVEESSSCENCQITNNQKKHTLH